MSEPTIVERLEKLRVKLSDYNAVIELDEIIKDLDKGTNELSILIENKMLEVTPLGKIIKKHHEFIGSHNKT